MSAGSGLIKITECPELKQRNEREIIMQKTYKRQTAKQIIAAKTGETNGDYNISMIHGTKRLWTYRTHLDGSGYVQAFGRHTQTTPQNADSIEMDCGEIIEI